VIFGVPEFRATLEKVLDRKDIMVKFYHELVRVDGANKVAWYHIKAAAVDKPELQVRNPKPIEEEWVGNDMVGIHFDLMHLAPPQTAPDFVRNSKLVCADGPQKGWVCVDEHTLQHKQYPNVFSLGDVAGLPTAKTGAAVRKQAPVVVENIMRLRQGRTDLWPGYNGYSSCPLVTGYGKMVLAEFEYGNKRASDPIISKFVDTTKENYSMWLLKKYGLPFMYWNLMLKGRA
ncbi:MAG: NAD(P)/FAD-dependent oxidoreductase, partial [Bacteroidetes bacterium]